jgi:hypothetical protein
VPLWPRYSAIRSPANVAANVFFFRTLLDTATGYQKSGLIPVRRAAGAVPVQGPHLHVPLLVATVGYLIAVALTWSVISGRKPTPSG